MYLWLLSEKFNLSIILSLFLLDDFFLNPNLFISSITLESGKPVLFSKNSNLLSFLHYFYIHIFNSIPHFFIACSKTLVWTKELWPIFDCVEYDSLLFFAVYVIYKKNYSFSRVVLLFFYLTKTAHSFYSKINDSSMVRTTAFSRCRLGVWVSVVPIFFTIYP